MTVNVLNATQWRFKGRSKHAFRGHLVDVDESNRTVTTDVMVMWPKSILSVPMLINAILRSHNATTGPWPFDTLFACIDDREPILVTK